MVFIIWGVVFMRKCLYLFLFILLLYACDNKNKEQENVQVPTKPTDVIVQRVVLQDIADKYTLPGTVEAWDDIIVPSETAGPITWIGKEEGSYVKRGEAILKINTDNLLANLNSAKVQLEDDKKEYFRQKNLFAQKAVSQKQFDTAKKVYDLAQVSYNLALDEYNKSTIKSPVTGIIDDVMPKIGEYVSIGTEIARLIDMSKLKIYVNVPENDVKYLHLGQEVDVYVAEIGGKKDIKKGIINYISVVSNNETLTHKVRIDIALDRDIRPGRIVRADIVRKTFKDVMVADMYAVIEKDDKKVVFINNKNIAEEREVVLGEMIGSKVIIVSGIEPGEELITSGQQFLSNGSTIRLDNDSSEGE